MNQEPHKPDAMERELLEHYRCHSHDEPSAQLDQRILAAAAAQAAQHRAEASRSFGERLHAWLFGAGGRQRWAVAVAGFATLGIGLSLTLRTQQEAEQRFDAPPASAATYSAPAAAPMSRAAPATLASPPAQAEKKASAMADSSGEIEARQQAPLQREEAAPKAEMAKAAPPVEPQASLQRVLALLAEGKREEAHKLLDELQARFPQRDIAAELREMERDR